MAIHKHLSVAKGQCWGGCCHMQHAWCFYDHTDFRIHRMVPKDEQSAHLNPCSSRIQGVSCLSFLDMNQSLSLTKCCESVPSISIPTFPKSFWLSLSLSRNAWGCFSCWRPYGCTGAEFSDAIDTKSSLNKLIEMDVVGFSRSYFFQFQWPQLQGIQSAIICRFWFHCLFFASYTSIFDAKSFDENTACSVPLGFWTPSWSEV